MADRAGEHDEGLAGADAGLRSRQRSAGRNAQDVHGEPVGLVGERRLHRRLRQRAQRRRIAGPDGRCEDVPPRARLHPVAGAGQILSAGRIRARSQRKVFQAVRTGLDRTVAGMGGREMGRDGGDRMLADASAAVDHNLELVDEMEVRMHDGPGFLLDQERLRLAHFARRRVDIAGRARGARIDRSRTGRRGRGAEILTAPDQRALRRPTREPGARRGRSRSGEDHGARLPCRSLRRHRAGSIRPIPAPCQCAVCP